MQFVIFFLQISFLYLTISAITTLPILAKSKKQLLSYQSKSTLSLDIGILSLNLMRLGKMKTYKISVSLFLSSKQAKSEVSLQKNFFKELMANMLYNFSFKDLKQKTILEKNYLKDLNIFVNNGHIKSVKIKIVNL